MIKVAVLGGRGPAKTDFTEQELYLKNSLNWRGESLFAPLLWPQVDFHHGKYFPLPEG